MIIAIQNLSSQFSEADTYLAVLACDYQAREHAAPAWGIWPPEVVYVTPGTAPPAGAALIQIADNTTQAGDLGFHTEGPGGAVSGNIFVEPVLQNGGNALTDTLSVCSVLSHEVLETLADSACNRWCDTGNNTAIALELCDPVENDSYAVEIGTSPACTVSNFVLPPWFDPDAASTAQFDWMKLVTAPFQVRDTGYVLTETEGTVSTQFGEHYPDWRKALKQRPGARTQRRLKEGTRAPDHP